jgi:hypothetical protein
MPKGGKDTYGRVSKISILAPCLVKLDFLQLSSETQMYL